MAGAADQQSQRWKQRLVVDALAVDLSTRGEPAEERRGRGAIGFQAVESGIRAVERDEQACALPGA